MRTLKRNFTRIIFFFKHLRFSPQGRGGRIYVLAVIIGALITFILTILKIK